MIKNTNYAFLHGGGQGSWVWKETIDALLSQYDESKPGILALDVPGCGVKRGRVTDALGIEDVAAELLNDIQKAGMEDVVLVGHSQAGQAICHMLEQNPALFRRVIYISCSLPRDGQTILEAIQEGIDGDGISGFSAKESSDPVESKLRYKKIFCNDMSVKQTEEFLDQLNQDSWPLETYSHTHWPQGHLAKVPSTFVLCTKDNILPPSWQEAFADRFKCERIVRVEAGHQVMLTQPEELARILIAEANN